MKTMNVYLNGRPDNGCLSGRVTGRQQISGKKTFIGRRAGERGFEFAGLIDEVRIYSRALTEPEIADEVEHAIAQSPDRKGVVDVLPSEEKHAVADEPCAHKPSGGSQDARVAGLAVTSGLLVAVVCAGVWSSGGWRMGSLLLSLLAGVALLPWLGPLVPGYFRTLMPLLSLLGGLSLIASVREGSE
jgi:hypothetical protein